MDDRKVIKKIFSLAYYDFNQNFSNWLSITGLHAIIISILFCGFCYISSDYNVTYWGWAPNIVFDWINKLYPFFPIDLLLSLKSLVLLAGVIIFPLIIIQNSLDLAFDSMMRGYSISSLIFSYTGAMILGNAFIILCIQLVSCTPIFAMLYFIQSNIAINICIVIMSMLILYFMQIAYFLSMDILEYKKGILQSCKDVYRMIIGKVVFLCKILLLQVLIAISAFIGIYVSLGFVIKVIMPFVLWFFNILSLPIEILFIVMMYNFFYLWAYILLYAWICLVTAHVYRQLICPPLDNSSCSSCTSCEK